jgi:hypothetical protein
MELIRTRFLYEGLLDGSQGPVDPWNRMNGVICSVMTISPDNCTRCVFFMIGLSPCYPRTQITSNALMLVRVRLP